MCREAKLLVYRFDLTTAGPVRVFSDGFAGTGMINAAGFDAGSVEFVAGNGAATAAEIEVKKNYTGLSGRSVSFGSPAALTKSTVRATALDIADCPHLEVVVTTAGASGEPGRLFVYGYTTTA